MDVMTDHDLKKALEYLREWKTRRPRLTEADDVFKVAKWLDFDVIKPNGGSHFQLRHVKLLQYPKFFGTMGAVTMAPHHSKLKWCYVDDFIDAVELILGYEIPPE